MEHTEKRTGMADIAHVEFNGETYWLLEELLPSLGWRDGSFSRLAYILSQAMPERFFPAALDADGGVCWYASEAGIIHLSAVMRRAVLVSDYAEQRHLFDAQHERIIDWLIDIGNLPIDIREQRQKALATPAHDAVPHTFTDMSLDACGTPVLTCIESDGYNSWAWYDMAALWQALGCTGEMPEKALQDLSSMRRDVITKRDGCHMATAKGMFLFADEIQYENDDNECTANAWRIEQWLQSLGFRNGPGNDGLGGFVLDWKELCTADDLRMLLGAGCLHDGDWVLPYYGARIPDHPDRDRLQRTQVGSMRDLMFWQAVYAVRDNPRLVADMLHIAVPKCDDPRDMLAALIVGLAFRGMDDVGDPCHSAAAYIEWFESHDTPMPDQIKDRIANMALSEQTAWPADRHGEKMKRIEWLRHLLLKLDFEERDKYGTYGFEQRMAEEKMPWAVDRGFRETAYGSSRRIIRDSDLSGNRDGGDAT